MNTTNNIAVIGGGSWATALVKILSEKEGKVTWWMRNEDAVAHIKKFGHNPNYISSAEFDLNKIDVTTNLVDAVNSSETIILAIPSAFLKNTLATLPKGALHNKTIFSAIKGIVPETLQIVGEFLNTEYGISYNNIGVITGPCHAEEVAMEKLSYLTVASQNEAAAAKMAQQLACRFIKTTVSDDIYGTEYSAVLKNVVAIAVGICHGLGFGDNFSAVLISNSIQEIKRFVDVVHPIDRDIKDSAYLGDLLVTTYSQFSRNRTFGGMLGKGYSVKNAQLEMNMIAEGYYAVECVNKINKELGVNMPISEAVFNIVYKNQSPTVEMEALSNKLS